MDGCIDEVAMMEDHPVIDWDDMSEADQDEAIRLLGELNKLFDKYTERGDSCENSISTE
jgi:hypothetical protein